MMALQSDNGNGKTIAFISLFRAMFRRRISRLTGDASAQTIGKSGLILLAIIVWMPPFAPRSANPLEVGTHLLNSDTTCFS